MNWADVDQAVTHLGDVELAATGTGFAAQGCQLQSEGRDHQGDLWHAIGIALLEEHDRRRRILLELAADIEDGDRGERIAGA